MLLRSCYWEAIVDFAEVMAELEALGTEQNRKIYRRRGAGENQFGVSFANIRRIAKQAGRDQALAEALWQTGNQDARSLATLIAEPKSMSSDDLNRWAESLDYYAVADMFSNNVAAASPLAARKAEAWAASGREFVEQAGWNVVAALAMKDRSLPDDYFEAWLERVEHGIDGAMNRTRHAMNGALIAIGSRNAALREQAEAIAERIGKVEVDHGKTGCVTPDAASYIAKVWERKKQPV